MALSNSTAFGIAQDADGDGTSPLDLRKVIEGRWEEPGIMHGLDVTATGSGMTYKVSEGAAVLQRSSSDGMTEAYWPGGNVTADPGDPGLDRYDVVWIKANDAAQGDPSNRIEVGITKGTPASSSALVSPNPPSGALVIARLLISAAKTQASSSDVVFDGYKARLRGVSQGDVGTGEWLNKTNGKVVEYAEAWTFATRTVTVDTEKRTMLALMAVSVRATDCQTLDWMGSGYVDLVVDGRVLQTFRFVCFPQISTTHTFFWTFDLAEGTHTVAARLWSSRTDVTSKVVTQYMDSYHPGQYLRVIDLGGTD